MTLGTALGCCTTTTSSPMPTFLEEKGSGTWFDNVSHETGHIWQRLHNEHVYKTCWDPVQYLQVFHIFVKMKDTHCLSSMRHTRQYVFARHNDRHGHTLLGFHNKMHTTSKGCSFGFEQYSVINQHFGDIIIFDNGTWSLLETPDPSFTPSWRPFQSLVVVCSVTFPHFFLFFLFLFWFGCCGGCLQKSIQRFPLVVLPSATFKNKSELARWEENPRTRSNCNLLCRILQSPTRWFLLLHRRRRRRMAHHQVRFVVCQQQLWTLCKGCLSSAMYL